MLNLDVIKRITEHPNPYIGSHGPYKVPLFTKTPYWKTNRPTSTQTPKEDLIFMQIDADCDMLSSNYGN